VVCRGEFFGDPHNPTGYEEEGCCSAACYQKYLIGREGYRPMMYGGGWTITRPQEDGQPCRWGDDDEVIPFPSYREAKEYADRLNEDILH